jgi:hypothetical protein
MKAWLIKWDWTGDHAAVADPIVTIMSARTTAEDVRKYVEQRYIEEKASLPEKLAYARYNQPQEPPYRAQLERGHISCGHNPWLEATKVDDLRVEEDADGEEVLKWARLAPVKARGV